MTGGDSISGKGLAAEQTIGGRRDRMGIVDLVARARRQQTGEIAGTLGGRRHRFKADGDRIKRPHAFVAIHKEGFVASVIKFG